MAYDMTVRDSGGHVVQFEYGADNLDPTDMEGKKGETVDFNRILNHVKVTLHTFDIKCNTKAICFVPEQLFEQARQQVGAVSHSRASATHRKRSVRP